jgi:polysaccharide biosynthesis transport protein
MAVHQPNARHGDTRHRNNANLGNRNNANVGNNVGRGNRFGDGGGDGGYEFRAASAKENVYEFLHVLFKRKRLIAVLFLAVALPSMVTILIFRRPVYLATAKVNIATDRANLTIQPSEVNALSTVKLDQAIVNSEVHLITSRDMLEKVVRGLAVANTEGGVAGLANAADGDADLGNRVLNLADNLKVTPIRLSNVIQIDYAASDPRRAAETVNSVLREYLSYNAEVHGQRNVTDFYEEQAALLEQNLRRAEETLRDFSVREAMISPDAEIAAQVNAIVRLEEEAQGLDATTVGAEERVRIVRDQLAEQPPLVKGAQYLDVNPVVKQLRSHLIDRKVDRIALLRKYTDAERLVRDNSEEISELQAELDDAMRDQPTVVTQQVFHPNPIYEARLGKLLDLEADLKEYRARQAAEKEAISRGRRRLVLLKQKALEFNSLDAEVQRRRELLDLYEKRGQEARISEAMDKKQLVNVEVVERPSLPLPRTGSKVFPLVLLALISGLAVSLGGALGWEYLNRTLRFERDVEHFLGLPMLGAIRDVEHA